MCDTGIVSENPSARRLLVRQSYPLKTGGEQNCESARKNAMEEVSRIITSDGTVIRTLLDGSTQVGVTGFDVFSIYTVFWASFLLLSTLLRP